MTINITPEIQTAYRAYLDDPVDADFTGNTIRRRDTYPFIGNEAAGMVDFAAGFQAARNAGVAPTRGCKSYRLECTRAEGEKCHELNDCTRSECWKEANAGVTEVRAPLPRWEPCNEGCDPEFNGCRSRSCKCPAALAALGVKEVPHG